MNALIPVDYSGERVLTTEQLAQAYGCEAHQIKQNFKNNEGRFEEGKHFYKLTGDALKDFKNQVENFYPVNKHTAVLYLWTRRGASRHSKMLGTDKAWEMFDSLEENYFNPRPNNLRSHSLFCLLALPARMADTITRLWRSPASLQTRLATDRDLPRPPHHVPPAMYGLMAHLSML